MDLYLLLCSGNRDKMISVFEELDDVISYISQVHSCKYIEDLTESTLCDQSDGKYLIADETTDCLTVYKVKTKTSEGYLYNSTYKKIKQIKKYKIISE